MNRRIYPSEQEICQLDHGTDGFTRRSRKFASLTMEPTDLPVGARKFASLTMEPTDLPVGARN